MNSILIFIFNITIMCVCVWMCEPFSKTVQFSNWKRRRNKSRYLFIFNYCEFRLKLVFLLGSSNRINFDNNCFLQCVPKTT